jgi:hypothetical protein
MYPIHFSVDCEFTDANPVHGRLMSVGIACANGKTMQCLLPVSTSAHVNAWTLQNNQQLLVGCYMMEQRTSRLPKLLVAGQWMNPQVVQAAANIQKFVQDQVTEAFTKALDNELVHDTHEDAAKFQAVMVTWSGGMDWAYLCNLFGRCNMDNPFHYKMVDASILAMALFPELGEKGWAIPQDTICEVLNIEPLGLEQKHVAINDARKQLEIFQALMEARHRD